MKLQIAALYCRLSKSDEALIESNSIATQKEILRKAALLHGYEQTQYFIDDGYSGTVFNRPALKQLEYAIETGCICAVLVKDVSRIGRDYMKVGRYIEEFFPKYNVRFISVTGDIDSDTNSTDFLPLYSVMDEWYAKDISRKMRLMYQSWATKGEPVGQPVYGYKRCSDNPKLWEIDSEPAKIVKLIYQLALDGYGISQIASLLEESRVLTPTYYNLSCGRSCGGAKKNNNPFKWSHSTIACILKRQEYCGDVLNLKTYSKSFKDKRRKLNNHDNIIIAKGVNEPIIERHLWEYLAKKRKEQKSRKVSKEPSLFSGLLRCGGCGSNMHYHFNQNNPSIEYYNCSNYVGNGGSCKNTHYVRLDSLKEYVLGDLNKVIYKAVSDWEYFSRLIIPKKMSEIKKQERFIEEELRSLSVRKNELSKLMLNLYEDKVKGTINEDTFILLVSELKKERASADARIKLIQEDAGSNKCLLFGLNYFKNLTAEHGEIKALSREILGKFINYIAIYPINKNGKDSIQEYDIHYQFIGIIEID